MTEPVVPPEILHHLGQRAGRVAVVVGAGCSLEHPTNLKLADYYSRQVHQQLVDQGVLVEGECPNPADLSILATTVYEKCDSQDPVVERMPRNKFRHAKPNVGHLIAAALLAERAIGCVLTLNFDMALTNALTALGIENVDILNTPSEVGLLGSSAVIYLHRNADAAPRDWVLREDVIEKQWQGQSSEVIVQRVLASPVTVFAGLGAPAAALTKTVEHIRQAAGDALKVYLVDPSATSRFQSALSIDDTAHIRMGWCRFMEKAANSVVAAQRSDLAAECERLCRDNDWPAETADVQGLCGEWASLGLVGSGRARARWLLSRDERYVPDDVRREHIADLLLGIGIVARTLLAAPKLGEDGIVGFHRDGRIIATALVATGHGTATIRALEPPLRNVLAETSLFAPPQFVLVAGTRPSSPADALPVDVFADDVDDDDIAGRSAPLPPIVTVDQVRAEPGLCEAFV